MRDENEYNTLRYSLGIKGSKARPDFLRVFCFPLLMYMLHMYVCLYLYLYACVYVCMYMRMYMIICVYVCKHM